MGKLFRARSTSLHKDRVIKRAREMANNTCWTIEICCNRVLMGKLFWKAIVLPRLLSGLGVLTFTKGQLDKLQVIENSVYRMILGGSAPNSFLRGEIEASLMRSRAIESRFLFMKSILEGGNELVKDILRKMIEGQEICGVNI